MNLIFKNKSQMLKGLQAGDIINIDNRLKQAKRKAIVNEVRSNSLILTSEEHPHSFLDFQNASTMQFNIDGTIEFKAFIQKNRYGAILIKPSPDFVAGETWLTISFKRKGN